MKVRDVIKAMEKDGWVLAGRVAITGSTSTRPSRKQARLPFLATDLPAGTLNSILEKAGVKR